MQVGKIVVVEDEECKAIGALSSAPDIANSKGTKPNCLKSLTRQVQLNQLQHDLIAPGILKHKLKIITKRVVDIFEADLCRIWLMAPGDLCKFGCIHAAVSEGPDVCRHKDKCLRLEASSGRYATHTNGAAHQRIPFGAHNIGRFAAGQESAFFTNNVASDPVIGDLDWANRLGLVSFAGFQLHSFDGKSCGVLALLSTRAISPEEMAQLDALSAATAQVICASQAEQALRDSEEHYRIAIECSNDGVAIAKGTINLFVNQKYVDMFGYRDAQELIGKPVSIVLHPDSIETWETITLKRQRGEPVPNQYELKGIRKNGELIYLEVSSARTIYRGEVVSLAYLRDITERKQAEEQRKNMEAQLRQAQKLEAIGQLASGIAHEINTPTQYIGDNIHFLQDAFGDLQKALKSCRLLLQSYHNGNVNPTLVADVETVVAQADPEYLADEIPKAISQSLVGIDRVATIVRAMKEFSHPGGDEKQTIDLNHAIENTLTVCRNEWKYVSEVVTDLAPDLPLVPCLAADINQAILNLVVNAAHAIGDAANGSTKSKGTIAVRTRRDGDCAEIRISDTGTGIPEQHRSKIFNPFFTTKEVGRGTGQGLSITHAIVVGKHGGTIEFETEVGKGTTFIIRLPLVPASVH
jgi:PAS domain S-box-containing protein